MNEPVVPGDTVKILGLMFDQSHDSKFIGADPDLWTIAEVIEVDGSEVWVRCPGGDRIITSWEKQKSKGDVLIEAVRNLAKLGNPFALALVETYDLGPVEDDYLVTVRFQMSSSSDLTEAFLSGGHEVLDYLANKTAEELSEILWIVEVEKL